MNEKIKAAPIGALSLLPLSLAAVCFPLIGALERHGDRTISVAVIVISSMLFSPAIVCSVYSIVFEKSRSFGLAGLLLAGFTLWIERGTLYFLEVGLLLIPGTVLMMLVIAKRRRKNAEHHIPQTNT
jgi:hypothetical protein